MDRRLWLLALVAFLGSSVGPSRSAEDKEDPKKQAVTKIEGTAEKKWEPKMPMVAEGDVVEWRIKAGKHGVTFKEWAKVKEWLTILEGTISDEGVGEAKTGAGTLLLKVKVGKIPEKMEIRFFCTQHGEEMDGKLIRKSEK